MFLLDPHGKEGKYHRHVPIRMSTILGQGDVPSATAREYSRTGTGYAEVLGIFPKYPHPHHEYVFPDHPYLSLDYPNPSDPIHLLVTTFCLEQE